MVSKKNLAADALIYCSPMTAPRWTMACKCVAWSHCVPALELQSQAYGSERRRVRVAKYRGTPFRSGTHDYKIAHEGLVVYPRLVADDNLDAERRC